MTRTARALTIVAVISLAGAPTSLWALGGNQVCVTVDLEDVGEAIELPDGTSQEAGQLKICNVRAFSPVASLHRIYVDGHPVGLVRSERRPAELASSSPAYMVFSRDELGRLRLVGFGNPAGKGLSYRLNWPRHEVPSLPAVEPSSLIAERTP